jgi:hypothetical protein
MLFLIRAREDTVKVTLIRTSPLLLIAAAMTSCGSSTQHSYEIEFVDKLPSNVTIGNCGKALRDDIGHGSANGQFMVQCEGGVVLISTFEKHAVNCTIGYVTPGESQKLWNFVVQGRKCRLRNVRLVSK